MIYVDPLLEWNAFGHKYWCHMSCTTRDLAPLHLMAIRIGLRRDWFQDKYGHPHYDLVESKRELAIRYGAISVNHRVYSAGVAIHMLSKETIRRLVYVQLKENPERSFDEMREKLLTDLTRLSRAKVEEVKAVLDEYLAGLLQHEAANYFMDSR